MISDINTQLHYSRAEEVCGTWVDGSPMYRRAYLETNVSISLNDNVHISTALNSSAIIPISIDILVFSANSWRTLANDSSAMVARGIVNSGGFYLINNFDTIITGYSVVITYIKI